MGSPLRTPLCDLLGIEHPIVLAPMTGGPSTPALVAAVSSAGGLGLYGVQGLRAEAVAEAVAATRRLTPAPFGVNVQLAAPFERGDAAVVQAALAPLRRALGLPEDSPAPPRGDAPLVLLEAAADAGAPILSVALGDPEPAVPIARAAGVPLIAMASTVAEARRCAEVGVDVVIAQGSEAGGHRTTFEVRPGEPPPLIGTMALVPQVVDAVDVPVVAAGGIADGRGVAAALALGAAGACLGTRFISAAESGAPRTHRERLRAARDEDTLVTDAVTGRPARWVRNRTVDVLRALPEPLGWGAQAAAVADVRAAAAAAGDADLLPMLAGQAAGLAADELPAAEIVARLVAEAVAVLRRLGRDARPTAAARAERGARQERVERRQRRAYGGARVVHDRRDARPASAGLLEQGAGRLRLVTRLDPVVHQQHALALPHGSALEQQAVLAAAVVHAGRQPELRPRQKRTRLADRDDACAQPQRHRAGEQEAARLDGRDRRHPVERRRERVGDAREQAPVGEHPVEIGVPVDPAEARGDVVSERRRHRTSRGSPRRRPSRAR